MSSVLGAPTSSPRPALVRAKVLVIDDEPGILNFVSRGLRAEGYTVELAADGHTGLSAALGQPYDLVILDLLLPGTSGIDLLRELVQQNPGQPVIVLSALTDTVSKVQSFELGAEDYLAKPFSIAHGEFGRALLAEREFLLLRELMSCAGETVSKERILASVWGYRFDPGSNVVDVYVRRLRAKIGGEAIKTVRGEGYRIDPA